MISPGCESKPKVLVVADAHGRRFVAVSLGSLPDFDVTVVFKPGAVFTAGLASLVQDFTEVDFVVVLGGSGDMDGDCGVTVPAAVRDALDVCFMTNVVVCSVPFQL